ncbi:alpha-(1,3)-fucosyltransferase B [Drosophila yakuba]|uniref:GDP-fucose protein O-fucosyltransferase n=1 Tax=Drosophila yakuba TaxID=7245 RepID=B4NY35_DROYA|nr:alpha-(1,3)-fucosyltransferase B [Drosophila yakuba]EDW88637.2 fut10 [Drosophila yakuba]
MRLARRYGIALVVMLLVWATVLYFCSEKLTNYDNSKSSSPVELVWWSKHMSWTQDEQRQCGIHTCRITNRRSRLPMARGVLFYGSNIKTGDFPLPRAKHQVWALLHEESPRNTPFVSNEEFLRHFHFTSTFSRYSNMPLTTQYLPSGAALTSKDYFVSFAGKSRFGYRPPTSVVFLQSDCDTMSGREDYVKALMKHLPIDSFGSCLRNKDLPESLQKDYLNNLYSPELLRFLSEYKFMIAIENAACPDYITEKFWRPLIMGVIPIYFGSPTIKDWQPNNKSAIFVNDFTNPHKLVEYLNKVADDQQLYDSYRQHKLNYRKPISNKKLLHNLVTRQYHMGDSSPGASLFEKFECAVCYHVINTARNGKADSRHYNCPLEPVYARLEGQEIPSNVADWRSMMEVGQCQAKILDEFFHRNLRFNDAEFDAELNRRIEANNCNNSSNI